MKITTLENGDRQLDLSQYECDTLIEVATYLYDHYDNLEFSIRNFTRDQVSDALGLLRTFDANKANHFTVEQIKLMDRIFAETCNLIDAKVLEVREDWDDVSFDLNTILFDHLQIARNIGYTTK